MKISRYYYASLVLLIIVVSTGCRSRGIDQVTDLTNEQSVDRSTGSIVVERRGKELPSAVDKSNTLRAKAGAGPSDEPAVFLIEGDYTNVDFIDVTNWERTVNETFGFSIFIPSGFAMFEDVPGRFVVGNEGVGDFYQILVGGADPGVGSAGEKLKKTHEVTIKDRFFLVEEYETSFGATLISYFANFGENWYRLNFFYYENDQDMLDLFRRSVETFELVR